jgi:leucyl aminopeptidase
VFAGVTGLPCFEEKGALSVRPGFDASLVSKAKKESGEKKFTGKNGESLWVAGGSVLLLGLGAEDKLTPEKIRRAAARLLAHAKGLKAATCRLDLDAFGHRFATTETAAWAVEGARLSDYKFNKYKSKAQPAHTVASFELASRDKSKKLEDAIRAAEIISESVLFTRDIANEPANVMTPVRLGQVAKEMARSVGLSCKVLGLDEIRRLKMGGVLGVSQGSSFPPQFIILENKPTSKEAPIVLVGKGVTFDTGGISIKPSGDMDKMKFDMCGAAAVLGAMRAIAKLKLPVRVVGIAPVVENMPGSKAQRPGDILTCMNGKTVEVLNTDAEGRLILADALAYAERYKPRALVDIATLTGACAAAFGDVCSGLMGTDPDLNERIKKAGETAGERVWELPLWDEYGELIRATYADIQNISKGSAGAITAGMFLKEFTSHTRAWAHLDVAGTAWANSQKPLAAIGSTGVGVRLFIELVKSYAK